MSRAKEKLFPLFIPHAGCPHACVFCDQRRISGQLRPVTASEVRSALEGLEGEGYTLAYYGGSFTALPIPEQEALLGAAQPYVERGKLRCLRVSTRPDAVDERVLELLAHHHVETVELGAQSMDPRVLLQSGRGHGSEDTVRATALLREHGFSVILQMMTGLPGADRESDLATAKRLAELRPDGVRVYPTVILRGTALEALWRSGAYAEHTVEEAVERCAAIVPIFESAGIPIIRLGLNPTEELSGGEVVGGAYHPALGELVRSRVLLERARRLLHSVQPGSDVLLGICKSDVSQLIGQHRCNVLSLEREFQLRSLRVRGLDLPHGELLRL